jgi:hypothetical protein
LSAAVDDSLLLTGEDEDEEEAVGDLDMPPSKSSKGGMSREEDEPSSPMSALSKSL